jgi:hypothetical protein
LPFPSPLVGEGSSQKDYMSYPPARFRSEGARESSPGSPASGAPWVANVTSIDPERVGPNGLNPFRVRDSFAVDDPGFRGEAPLTLGWVLSLLRSEYPPRDRSSRPNQRSNFVPSEESHDQRDATRGIVPPYFGLIRLLNTSKCLLAAASMLKRSATRTRCSASTPAEVPW